MDRICFNTSSNCPKKNTKLAFEESIRIITSLYEGEWRDEQEVVVDDVLGLTTAVSSPTPLSTRRG